MKRILLACAALVLMFGTTGCVHRNLARNGCRDCGPERGACRDGCGPGMARGGGPGHRYLSYDPSPHYSTNGMPGPPTAQVAYPYYTTRGPRDFLLDNPPSIGR